MTKQEKIEKKYNIGDTIKYNFKNYEEGGWYIVEKGTAKIIKITRGYLILDNGLSFNPQTNQG